MPSTSNLNLEMLVFEEGKTEVPGEKPLRARMRSNNKLNPHMASTLVGGKCSHHYNIPAPLLICHMIKRKNMEQIFSLSFGEAGIGSKETSWL